MALQLSIRYEQLIELIEQLSPDQRDELVEKLLTRSRAAHPVPMTVEDKIRLLDAAKIRIPVNEEPSVRRADWYGDDGR
jgi:hypothetical protein